ncbi:hypothetical protein [Bradyrhizobium sp. HKCCYLR20261]
MAALVDALTGLAPDSSLVQAFGTAVKVTSAETRELVASYLDPA